MVTSFGRTNFVSSEITIDGFYQKMPQYKNEDFIVRKYNEIIFNKDGKVLGYLRHIPTKDIRLFEGIYRQLLSENWHIEHEDIVGLFLSHFNKDVENIHILSGALINIPAYLQEGEATKYSYIKKNHLCYWCPTPTGESLGIREISIRNW
ncbi:MAG: hypothetical protein K6A82_04810 [Prevotella sp.]|nr:hypothetical protein [Prevotella sp.]